MKITIKSRKTGIRRLFEKWGWTKPFFISLDVSESGFIFNSSDKKLLTNAVIEFENGNIFSKTIT